jgi:peroxiredoxin
VIVGISVDTDGPEAGEEVHEGFGINYMIVMAMTQVQDAFGPIQGYPTTFIIDRDGNIRDKKLGREPTAEFEKAILAVLKPAAP